MKRLASLVLLAIFLAVPAPARADIAPPARPPGSNLQPGPGTTRVRMMAETVLLDVRAGASSRSLGIAHVTADFTMRNLGEAPEVMAVRFPMGATDGWSSVNELHDLRVKVDERPVSTRRITGEDPYNSTAPVPWAEFDATFPPGKDVQVQVQYTLEAAGEYPYIWFKYVLSTGAAWEGSIGSAEILMRLPYQASLQNVLMDTDEIWFGTTRGGKLSGDSIRWHYDNLDPTEQDNFEVNLVMPAAWQNLLAERRNVAQNPRDGEAWGRLGKLSKEMAFSSRGKGFRAADVLDAGAAELYQQSLEAYDKAVTILPKDALWHAGYADLLTYHAYFDAFNGRDTTDEALHGMREIRLALELAPNDPKVREIADRISWSFPVGVEQAGDSFVFRWLTATPVPSTSTLPAPTEMAQNVPASATPAAPTALPADATARPQPTPSPVSNPLCGSAIIYPALLAGLVLWRSKRRICTP